MVIMSVDEACDYLVTEQKSQKHIISQMENKISELSKEIQALRTKANKPKKLYINVSEKGLD